MKVVVAIDSFKGSMSSMEAGNAIREGILEADPLAEVIVRPLADGGEGTVEALVDGMNGEWVKIPVTGPLGEKTDSVYGIIQDRNLAIIEMAGAAGLPMVPEGFKNPMKTTTYGVGELILDAIGRGCREFIIGLGGSATNEAGIGMLEALGYVFYDSDGNEVGKTGTDFLKIASIDCTNVMPVLKECHFKVACDVSNPLFGPEGATYIYGPQKGVTPDMAEILDSGMKNLAEVVKRDIGKDLAEIPGTGAAGGLGYAFLTFLNASLEPGRDIILNAIGLEECMPGADFVITGEGRLDQQTAMGKGPIGVARLGKKYGAKVIGLAGGITKDVLLCNAEGIDGCFSILQEPCTMEQAMERENALYNLKMTARQLFQLLRPTIL